jgi:hypothetical protein
MRTDNALNSAEAVDGPAGQQASRPAILSMAGGAERRDKNIRYLKSALGCLPCSFTHLLSCVVDALS